VADFVADLAGRWNISAALQARVGQRHDLEAQPYVEIGRICATLPGNKICVNILFSRGSPRVFAAPLFL